MDLLCAARAETAYAAGTESISMNKLLDMMLQMKKIYLEMLQHQLKKQQWFEIQH